MSEHLTPRDNGLRRFRPGPILWVSVGLTIIASVFLINEVRKRHASKATESPTPIAESDIREELNEVPAVEDPPKPVEPLISPTHPLTGLRRLFLANGSAWRKYELTYETALSEQHSFPVVTLENNDPFLWDFRPIVGKDHVYQIFGGDEQFPETFGKELTYTRLRTDPLWGNEHADDDSPPYLTLRDGDPCAWKVHQRPETDTLFQIFCVRGSEPWTGRAIGWNEKPEAVTRPAVTATLENDHIPSWWILPPGKTPPLARRVSHLVICPTGNEADLEDIKKAGEHFEKEGHGVFRVRFDLAGDTLTRTAQKTDFTALAKALRQNDPVIHHPGWPSGLRLPDDPLALAEALAQSALHDSLFPLVIPLGITLHNAQITSLRFENTEFWRNGWETLDDFQSHLSLKAHADGRVYEGEQFRYFFISWDE